MKIFIALSWTILIALAAAKPNQPRLVKSDLRLKGLVAPPTDGRDVILGKSENMGRLSDMLEPSNRLEVKNHNLRLGLGLKKSNLRLNSLAAPPKDGRDRKIGS